MSHDEHCNSSRIMLVQNGVGGLETQGKRTLRGKDTAQKMQYGKESKNLEDFYGAILHIDTKIEKKRKSFFLVMRALKIYSLNNFQIYHAAIFNLSHHAVHYIPSICLSNSYKLVPFGPFIQFLLP